MIVRSAIPVNVVTGFLGVGKTTAILSLLEARPQGERWAVLVNEFGEVGIDGTVLNAAATEQGVFVSEVPGGCICCAAGVPLQVALNRLLKEAAPDRLLIEPTGLGHPRQILKTLSSGHYNGVLDLKATITLVDARKIQDSRYTEHDTFKQQLAIADVVVANKSDLYTADEFEQLQLYLQEQEIHPVASIKISHGQLPGKWLDAKTTFQANEGQGALAALQQSLAATSRQAEVQQSKQMPESGVLRLHQEQREQNSFGWIFAPRFVFAYDKLESLTKSLSASRIKAVVITDRGICYLNMVDQSWTVEWLDEVLDSRFEIISAEVLDSGVLEQQLLDCIV